MYKCNIEVHSCNHCCREKAICITYSECKSVAFVIQHTSSCSILCCHLWPVWLYHIFAHYCINGTVF